MITTKELLAKAKAEQGIPSNYRLARVLDIPETTVMRWNTGRNRPDDEAVMRLAELAGIDPGAAVAAIRAERAEDGPLRELWVAMAKRLQGAAAAVFTAIVSVWITLGASSDVRAMTMQPAPVNSAASVYTLSRIRALARRLWARLLRCLHLVAQSSRPTGVAP